MIFNIYASSHTTPLLTCVKKLIRKLEVLKPGSPPWVEDTVCCRCEHCADDVRRDTESHPASCLLQQLHDSRRPPGLHKARHDRLAVQAHRADFSQSYCSKGSGVAQADRFRLWPQSNVASGDPAQITGNELQKPEPHPQHGAMAEPHPHQGTCAEVRCSKSRLSA